MVYGIFTIQYVCFRLMCIDRLYKNITQLSYFGAIRDFRNFKGDNVFCVKSSLSRPHMNALTIFHL